ncbi:MAG: indole-3-glycerol-phosphate synthase [Oscillatoriales cyanobacterium SM2_2_1]|nr:indole-3-glycerol-phosphate synthase [Oscillatoriales cyanobacterium SM2_2_1]
MMQVRRQKLGMGYPKAGQRDDPQNVLEKIVWQKEGEVSEWRSPHRLKSSQMPPVRSFLAALRDSPQVPALIAEVKRVSPSRGVLREDFDPVSIAQDYVAGGAQCLSVLTDAVFFGGGFEVLAAVRGAVEVPLLCKEFVIDAAQVYRARQCGADAVLLIATILHDQDLLSLQQLIQSLGMTALIEVHSREERDRVLALPNVELIGINNRNLADFTVSLEQTARLMGELSPEQRRSYLWVSESGIFSRTDLDFVAAQGGSAVLVGEALVRQPDITAAVRRLLQPVS